MRETCARLQLLSDEQLMMHVKALQYDALGVLFDRYHRLILSVGFRILRDSGEAEDLAQSESVVSVRHRYYRGLRRLRELIAGGGGAIGNGDRKKRNVRRSSRFRPSRLPKGRAMRPRTPLTQRRGFHEGDARGAQRQIREPQMVL